MVKSAGVVQVGNEGKPSVAQLDQRADAVVTSVKSAAAAAAAARKDLQTGVDRLDSQVSQLEADGETIRRMFGMT